MIFDVHTSIRYLGLYVLSTLYADYIFSNSSLISRLQYFESDLLCCMLQLCIGAAREWSWVQIPFEVGIFNNVVDFS